jgi:DNA-directed RNA polymerase specialized sigma24 family protein
MRRSKKKSFKEVITKPCGSSSPYWNWLERHVHNEQDYLNEPPEANPDVLSEEAHLYHRDLTELDRLQLNAVYQTWDKFSAQEKVVLELCGYEGKRVEDAARILHILPESVATYLKRAAKKIDATYQRLKLHDK